MAFTEHRINGDTQVFREKTEDREVYEAALADMLSTTLDIIVVGIIIVADDARILYANETGRRMLDARSPIVSLGSRLAALRDDQTKELRAAIAVAGANRPNIGATGIGVPLVHRDATAAIAHVLPLDGGLGTAAVFVTPTATLPIDVSTVARIFGLTPAETRLLQQMAAGACLSESARALGINEETAKTHLKHIFAKTGVSGRANLLALIRRLVPPISSPSAGPHIERTKDNKFPLSANAAKVELTIQTAGTLRV